MEATFQEVIRERTRDGTTVLLSSHILAEVEALADSVTIIREGRAVESGSLASLRHLTRTAVTVETTTPPADLAGMPGVHELATDDGHVSFTVDGGHLDAVMRYLSGLGIRSLVSRPPTLEQLFLRHYAGTEGEAAP